MPGEADVLLNLEANANFSGLQKGVQQANQLFNGLASAAERSSKDTQSVISALSNTSLEASNAKKALDELAKASRIDTRAGQSRGQGPVARETRESTARRKEETAELTKQINRIQDITELEMLGNQAKARSATAAKEQARIEEEIQKIQTARAANNNRFASGEKQRISNLLQIKKILEETSAAQRGLAENINQRVQALQRANQTPTGTTADTQAVQSRLKDLASLRVRAERNNTAEQNRQVQATQANVRASQDVTQAVTSAHAALQRNIQAREEAAALARKQAAEEKRRAEQQHAADLARANAILDARRRASQQQFTRQSSTDQSGAARVGTFAEVQARAEIQAQERAAAAEQDRRRRFIEGLREAARVREETARRDQQLAEEASRRDQLIAARNRTQEREKQEDIRRTQEIERAALTERRRAFVENLRQQQQPTVVAAGQAQLPGAQGRDALNLIQQINTARARQPEIINQIRSSETSLQQLRESFFRKRDVLNASVNTQEQRILREQLGHLQNAIRERDKGLQQLREEQSAIEANTKSLERQRNVLNRQTTAGRQATPADTTAARQSTPLLDVERFAAGVERQRQQSLDRSRLSVENLSKAIGNYNNQLKRNQAELNKTQRGQRRFQTNMIQTLGTAAQFAGVLHSMTFALGTVSRGWRDANTRGERFQALLPVIIGGVIRLASSLGRVLFPVQEALDFEQSIVRLSTQIGLAEQVLTDVGEQVRDLAVTFARPLDALGNAAFFIQSAGHRGATAARLLDATAKSAAIALGEEVEVARLLAAAVTAYGEESLSAARASEILLSTVREGALEAKDLTSSLGRVLAPAQTLGVEFEELGATIAFYTRLGVNANEATTALRSILLALLRPSRTAAKSLELVGSSLEEVRASVRDRGLITTLQDLRDVYGENTEAFTKFLGRKEAIALALALTGRNAQNVDNIYRSVADTTENLDQATERMSETMQFKLNQSMAVFREIGIELVTKVLPPIASGLNTIANLFRSTDPIAKYTTLYRELFAELDSRVLSDGQRAVQSFIQVLEEADDAPENLRAVIEVLREFGETGDFTGAVKEQLGEQLLGTVEQARKDFEEAGAEAGGGFGLALQKNLEAAEAPVNLAKKVGIEFFIFDTSRIDEGLFVENTLKVFEFFENKAEEDGREARAKLAEETQKLRDAQDQTLEALLISEIDIGFGGGSSRELIATQLIKDFGRNVEEAYQIADFVFPAISRLAVQESKAVEDSLIALNHNLDNITDLDVPKVFLEPEEAEAIFAQFDTSSRTDNILKEAAAHNVLSAEMGTTAIAAGRRNQALAQVADDGARQQAYKRELDFLKQAAELSEDYNFVLARRDAIYDELRERDGDVEDTSIVIDIDVANRQVALETLENVSGQLGTLTDIADKAVEVYGLLGHVDLGDLEKQLAETAVTAFSLALAVGDTEEALDIVSTTASTISALNSVKQSTDALEMSMLQAGATTEEVQIIMESLGNTLNSLDFESVRRQTIAYAAESVALALALGNVGLAMSEIDAASLMLESQAKSLEGQVFANVKRFTSFFESSSDVALGLSDQTKATKDLEDAAGGAGDAVETLASKIGTYQSRLIDAAVDQVLFVILQGDLEGAIKEVTEVLDGQIPRWNSLSEVINLTRQLIEQEVTEAFQKFKDSQEEASEETETYNTILNKFQTELKETAIDQAALAALSGDTAKAIEALGSVTSDSIRNLAAQQAAIEVLVTWYDQEYNKVLEEHREELGLASDETESYVSTLEDMRSKLVDVAVEQAVLAARQGNVAQAFDIANAAANGQVKELNSILAAIDVVTEYIEQQFNKQWEEYVEAQEGATDAAEGFISALDEMRNQLVETASEQVLMTALQGNVAEAMALATDAAGGQIKELNTLSAAAEVIQKFISQQFTQAWNDYTEAQEEAEEATRTFSDVLGSMSSAITRTIADMALAAIVAGDFAKATEVLGQVNDENSRSIFAAQHVYELLTDFIQQEFTAAFEDATDAIDDQQKSIQELSGELGTLQSDIVSIAAEMIVAAAAAGDYSRALEILRITEEGELGVLNKRGEAIQLVSQYLSGVGLEALRDAKEEQDELEDSTRSLSERVGELTDQYIDFHTNAIASALLEVGGLAKAQELLQQITEGDISTFNKFGQAVQLISSYIKNLGTETNKLVSEVGDVDDVIDDAINEVFNFGRALDSIDLSGLGNVADEFNKLIGNIDFSVLLEDGKELNDRFKEFLDGFNIDSSVIDAIANQIDNLADSSRRLTFDEFKEQLSDLERATSRALEDQDDAIRRLEREADRASEHLTGDALALFNQNQQRRVDDLRDAFDQARKQAERNLEDQGERADDIADAIRKAFDDSGESNDQIATVQELIAALEELGLEATSANFGGLIDSSKELPDIFKGIEEAQESVNESTEEQILSVEELIEALKELGLTGSKSVNDFYDTLNNSGNDPYEVLRQQTAELAEDLKDEPRKSLEELLTEIKTVFTPQFQESLGGLFDKYEVTVDFNQSAYDQALAELDKEFEVQAEINDDLITEEQLRMALETIQGIKLEVPTDLDEITEEQAREALQVIADAQIEVELIVDEITEEQKNKALEVFEDSDRIEIESEVNLNDDEARVTLDSWIESLEAYFEEFDGKEIQIGLDILDGSGSGGGRRTNTNGTIDINTEFKVNLDTSAIDAAYNDIKRITEEYNRFTEGQGGTEADPGAVVQVWTGYRFDGSANAFARRQAESEVGAIIREYGEFVSGQGGTESDPGAVVQAWTGYQFDGQENAFARDAAQRQVTENIETYSTFISGIGGTEPDPGAVVQYWTGYNFDGTANATARMAAETDIGTQVNAHQTTIDTNSNTSDTPDNVERHWRVTAIDTTDTVTNTSSITGGVGALDSELEIIRMSLGVENIDYLISVIVGDQTDTTMNTQTIIDTVDVPRSELETIRMALGVDDVTYPFSVTAKGKEEGVTTQVGSAYDHIVDTFVKPELLRKGNSLREGSNIFPVPFPFQIVPRNPGGASLAIGGIDDYGTGIESTDNAGKAYEAISELVKQALGDAVPTEIYPVDFPFQLVPKDEAGLSVAAAEPAYDLVKDDVDMELDRVADIVGPKFLERQFELEAKDTGESVTKSETNFGTISNNITTAIDILDAAIIPDPQYLERLFELESKDTGESITKSEGNFNDIDGDITTAIETLETNISPNPQYLERLFELESKDTGESITKSEGNFNDIDGDITTAIETLETNIDPNPQYLERLFELEAKDTGMSVSKTEENIRLLNEGIQAAIDAIDIEPVLKIKPVTHLTLISKETDGSPREETPTKEAAVNHIRKGLNQNIAAAMKAMDTEPELRIKRITHTTYIQKETNNEKTSTPQEASDAAESDIKEQINAILDGIKTADGGTTDTETTVQTQVTVGTGTTGTTGTPGTTGTSDVSPEELGPQIGGGTTTPTTTTPTQDVSPSEINALIGGTPTPTPTVPTVTTPTIDVDPNELFAAFGLHEGGVVQPRPGGTPAIIGEGGQAEAVIPLERGLASILGHNIPDVVDMQMATEAGVTHAFEGIIPRLIEQQRSNPQGGSSQEPMDPQMIQKAVREGMLEALKQVSGRQIAEPSGTNYREAYRQARSAVREGAYNWGVGIER